MSAEPNFKPKTFAVIGAGPVGSIVAAFLAQGGYKTILCDLIPELLEYAIKDGIIISGAENIKHRVSAVCTNVKELTQYNPDVIIIATKTNANAPIAASIKAIYKEGIYIVSWQNGIDTELAIAEIIDKKALMRAVVNYGCMLKANGHTIIKFHHPPHYIKELAAESPESIDAANGIAYAFTKAGLNTEYTDNIASMIWRKSCMNATLNPICALTRLTMSEANNNSTVKVMISSLLKECIKIAEANKIDLGKDYYQYAIDYTNDAGNHKPSMLLDIESNRKTEIDFMNGKFVEYGKKAGIETPYNVAITALIKGLEDSFKRTTS